MRAGVARAWARLTEGWGCPGDGCSGIFSSPDKAQDHARIARVIGSHEVAPQRRARRARSRAARQLRSQARRAAR